MAETPVDIANRSLGESQYTRLVQLASARLRVAAGFADVRRQDPNEAVTAEADSIIAALEPVGTELTLGNALTGAGLAGGGWTDIANDLRAVGEHLAHAAEDIGHAVDAAANAVVDAVGAVVDSITHAIGGTDITQLETIQVVGLIEQIAVGGTAEDLALAKQSVVQLYTSRARGGPVG